MMAIRTARTTQLRNSRSIWTRRYVNTTSATGAVPVKLRSRADHDEASRPGAGSVVAGAGAGTDSMTAEKRMEDSASRVPVLVLNGFLGSGKTTLLESLGRAGVGDGKSYYYDEDVSSARKRPDCMLET